MEAVRLEVKDGSFRYPGYNRVVLDRVNFSADSGDIVAILGPNGAGKTTLLRCAMSLRKWQSGASYLDGRNVRDIPHRRLWEKLSFVPQAAQVSAAYTVEEMVLLGRSGLISSFAVPGKRDIEQANLVLERLGIVKLKGKSCAEISGGELQLVLIARALVSEPEVLILDEPESNLDFKNQLIVLNTMSELASGGITCIFNTHYPAHALRRANKALMLSNDAGHIFGDTRAIVTESNIEKYFGVRAVIGVLEGFDNSYQTVIPVSVSGEDGHGKAEK